MPHVQLDKQYVLEGRDIAALIGIAYRFNDGEKMTPDERRDQAQRMKAILDKRVEVEE